MAETKNTKTAKKKATATKAASKPAVKKTTATKAASKPAVKKTTATKAVSKPAVKKTTATKAVSKPVVKKTTATKAVSKPVVKKTKASKKKCFLKGIFKDVGSMYKNFIHWNLSKLVIHAWAIVLGVLFIIPVAVAFFIYTMVAGVDLNNFFAIFQNGLSIFEISSYMWELLFVALMIFIYFIAFSYSHYLLMNVNNGYIDGNNLGIKKNEYFSMRKIVAFFNISLINIAILLIPVVLFLVSMLVLISFGGGVDKVYEIVSSGMNNYITILSFVFLIICSIIFIHLYYRILFSYYVLTEQTDSKKKISAWAMVSESFEKTAGAMKFFKFLSVSVLFVILLIPVTYVGEYLEREGEHLFNYATYVNMTDAQKENITEAEYDYVVDLKLKYGNISADEIVQKYNYNTVYGVIYGILGFLFLTGLYVMIYSSFYRKELKS